jgi:plastocyanin
MTIILAVASLGLAACGNTASEAGRHDVTRVPIMSDAAAQATREAALHPATPGAEGAASPAAAAPAARPAPAAAQPIEIASFDIYFEPKEVTIPADTDVAVSLPNKGVSAHNFSIDALGISVDLPPGETQTVTINAPAGTYEFYCNVPGHKEAGMVGTLVVSPGGAAAAPQAATPAAATAATPAAPGATPVPAAAPVTAAATPGGAAPAGGPVQIASHDIFFEPKELTIPASTDVTIGLPNGGVTAHNFSIDALGISVDIAPGETQQVAVNAPPGTYEFYCNVPGHKEAGMVGTLTVE